MPIVPLPQFEADLAEHLREHEDREVYERLTAPTSMVVRFGAMRMVGEFPYDGEAKPGCGSKLVVRTHRGEELGEMLTSTCPNSGCSKSVTRREMLEYIENSGGKDYPFFDAKNNRQGVKGRVLRIAAKEDLDRQASLVEGRRARITRGRELAREARFHAKVVDVEPVLGGGYVCYYYLTEDHAEAGGSGQHRPGPPRGGQHSGGGGQRHIDHGPFLERLKREHPDERVEVRHVGARDEARLTADYERCGQHCCCKNFLKVLKPVSMRSAKVQKATLDPLKISGRCGRLMCCLRYEDQTYKDLKKNLPHRKTRWGTPHGDGIVIDSQILTQLVLIQLDVGDRVAVPVEELTKPESLTAPERPPPRERGARPQRGADRPAKRPPPKSGSAPSANAPAAEPHASSDQQSRSQAKAGRRRKPQDAAAAGGGPKAESPAESPTDPRAKPPSKPKAKPKVGGRRRKPGSAGDRSRNDARGPGNTPEAKPADDGAAKKKRRRRRRSLGGGSSENPGGGPSSDSPDTSGGDG
ncbi:MAG: regulatory iron-sulfur-containing complex subunit RicT [Planctomycetota bacterium]